MTYLVSGDKVLFTYPFYGTPDSNPDHTAHSGQIVTVVNRVYNSDEKLDDLEPIYVIRADDGWEGEAWGDELTPI